LVKNEKGKDKKEVVMVKNKPHDDVLID